MERIKWFGIWLLFVLGFTIIFKDMVLFFTEDKASYSLESIQSNYVVSEDGLIAVDETSEFHISDLSLDANEITILFEKGLCSDSVITAYVNINGEERLLGTRTFRKNVKKVRFYTSVGRISDVRVMIVSENPENITIVPTGRIVIQNKSFCPIQKKLSWVFCVIGIALLSTVSTYFVRKRRRDKDGIGIVKKRESNLEWLRVLCMIALVGHHYAVHGGLLSQPQGTWAFRMGEIFFPVGKICFIAFIAISMWFYVDRKEFRFERFLKTWVQVFSYSVLFTGITWLMGAKVSLIDFISSFFVMIGDSHGFAASYLIFVLLLPLLSKMVDGITKEQTRYVLIILFLIQVCSQILKNVTGYNQPVYSELTLFILCYFISLYLKRWPISIQNNVILQSIILFTCYCLVFLSQRNVMHGKNGLFEQVVSLLSTTCGESAVLFIIAGYSLFFIFKNLSIKHNQFVNTIAGTTFGILLIHDHNFFRYVFWKDVVQVALSFSLDTVTLPPWACIT